MKKTKRKVPRLSRNATDEEIIRWTKSHDVFDRLEPDGSDAVVSAVEKSKYHA